VTFIDAPQLKFLNINFSNQIDFHTPRLAQFINHTAALRVRDEAHVYLYFDNWGTGLALLARHDTLEIRISYKEPHSQLSFVAQLCNTSLYPLSTVETLYIGYKLLTWQSVKKTNDVENTLWLQLLLPFTAVKNLYLFEEFAPCIAATLQELAGGRSVAQPAEYFCERA
jgi:hypothetical protein